MNGRRDRGATAVEYGLMLAAIAALIVAVVFGFGNIAKGLFQETQACFDQEVNAVSPCFEGQ
jgi:pilus assembly protein Flp/PilA